MRLAALLLLLPLPAIAGAQVLPQSTIAEMATTPLVKLQIAETLRTPPDEASITVGTQSRAPTATAAAAANKEKTERLLATIRRAGLRERDIQTQGIQLSPEYNYVNDPATGRGRQVFNGYVASNSIQLKTRDIPRLTALLDTLTTAGADTVYGPNFSISDPLPLRAEARKRALARGQSEALEYARAQGFSRVSLLSMEEGTSYRGTDVVVTASRVSYSEAAPPAPPPAPLRDGIVAPGQLETGISLNLVYRMER
ncbi:SIMPL domain-containing protein [Sphingomonas swuensis]|uniref:SIMPL domain-containing protein n=1 Tax=Sphingomonas swuensis TaxID=977800 RepID=A0ABP7SR43_9SPHN